MSFKIERNGREEGGEASRHTSQRTIESARNLHGYAVYSIHNTGKGLVIGEGICENSPSIIVEMSEQRVITVNKRSHELLRVNDYDLSGIEHNQVLDLSDEGDRWEGDVLNDKPCGWGELFDSEGMKAYEGFRIGDVSVCYGRSYYADIQKTEYEGGICEGKRWGRGTLYDRAGNILFNGEWINDSHEIDTRVVLTPANEQSVLLHNRIEELVVSDKCCNGEDWRVLDVSLMPNLRELQVGDCCFEKVEEVRIMGMKRLERVAIGKKSFTMEKNSFGNDPNRRFFLKDCDALKELKIERFSFSDYAVCEIQNVPSLEWIQMGNVNEWSYNFSYASLELKNMPKLTFLRFGDYAFQHCHSVVFESHLPELLSIQLGDDAFCYKGDDCGSELVMRNLPKLVSFTTKGENSWSLRNPHHITLESMPSLSEVMVPCSFHCSDSIHIKNVSLHLSALSIASLAV